MAELYNTETIIKDPFVDYLNEKMAQLRDNSTDFDQFLSLAKRKGFKIIYPEAFKRIYWDRYVTNS